MKKRILSLLLCAAMLLTLMPSVFADGEPTVTIASVEAAPGTTGVNVTMTIANNPGVCGVKFAVSYDTAALELKNITYGPALKAEGDGPGLTFTKPGNLAVSPINVYGEGMEEGTDNGVFATLVFNVKSDAAVGAHAITATYNAGDIYDFAQDDVDVVIVYGGITVPCTEHVSDGVTDCTQNSVCTVCGTVLRAAGSHTSDGVTDCTQNSVCTVCGAVLRAAGEHTSDGVTDCTQNSVCTVCGATLRAAGEHTSDGVTDCTQNSVCTVCGATLRAAGEHTSDGVTDCTQNSVCTVCGATLRAAGQHSWNAGTESLAPTCTAKGTMHYTCTACGATKDEDINPLGHNFVTYVSDGNATCKDDGTKTATCERDGCNETHTITDVGSHLNVAHTSNGVTDCSQADICTVCGATIRAAGQHSWNAGTESLAPTCTAKGTMHYTCTVCSAEKDEDINPLGHSPVYTVDLLDSAKILETCSRAGCTHNETATLSATDATYTGSAVTTASVAYSDGWLGGTLTIAYENNINAGTATAKITMNEQTASVNFTIAKADPTAAAPTATAAYGQTLADVTLTNPAGNTAGTWAWVADASTSVGGVGNNTFAANFTPTDTTNYNTVENVNVTVTVGKADPSYTVPTELNATYGDTLSSVTLPTGWAWTNGEQTVGNAGNNTFTATFTPTDTTNYNTVENVNVSVTVAKADPIANAPTATATYGDTLADVTLTNPDGNTAGTWAWVAEAATSVGNAGVNSFAANFTPTDTTNYNTVENVDVTVTVGKANPIATAPTATATYGQTLADVTLTNPAGNTAGTWAWVADTATSVGGAGSKTFAATFTPSDPDNYNLAENVNVTVTVAKADPSYTAPTGLAATYGDTLSSVTLPTGWAWTNGEQSVGNAGDKTFTATFTPDDTDNYNVVENVDVTVTVAKVTEYTITLGNLTQYVNATSPVTATISPVDATAVITVEYEVTTPESPCTHVHDGNCGYDGTDINTCTHVHDGNCGYAPESTGWTADVPTQAGTYKVRAALTSSDNLTPIDPVSYTEGTLTIYTYSSGGGSYSGTKTSTVVINNAKSGKVSASTTAPKVGDQVVITVKPDEGFEVKTVTVTDAKGNAIPVTVNADGTYTFTQPDSAVTVDAEYQPAGSTEPEGFVDVAENSYYEEAVAWAVEKGVTTGTDETHFSPNAPCTRAQMVTFLWRAAGSPEPTAAAAFTDVKADAYYAKAVAWAAENEITKGTSETTFSPDAAVTRGQTVTFLFRALKGEAGGENPFTDVAEGAFYADAVKWAVAKNITTGTSATTFSPEADCTRAQIVTFLYRAYAK